MPNLTYTSQVGAQSGRTSTPMLPGSSDLAAFGGATGQAMQNVGQGISQVGAVAGDYAITEAERTKQADLANHVAQNDYTMREAELKNTVPVEEFHDTVVSDYKDWVSTTSDKIEDNNVRQAYTTRMLNELPNISARAADYQTKTQTALSTDDANYSLNTLQNRIAQNPDQFNSLIQQGNAVIAARPNVPPAVKTAMQQQWLYDGSRRTFEGMLQGAKTPEDLDRIATQLVGKAPNGKDWSENFQPEDYKTLADKIGSLKRSTEEKVKTDAKAVLSQAESRTNEHVSLIPDDEMQATQDVVKRTSDPDVYSRMAAIVRGQTIIRNGQRLPPSEIRAQINAANGNPGMAYPDLPPVVSDAVNKAADDFGVSAGYLGGTAHREYGQYLKKTPVTPDKAFIPQPTHGDVDLRNIRSDALDAATQAGKMLGAPLMLTKGSKDTGLNIITTGMSDEQQAKIAGALVDSGFTGLAQYPDHLAVDMRTSVPQEFGEKDGRPYGGWTYLTPAVAAKLKDKGFAAGADNSIIKRAGVPQQVIDYGHTTQIKDEKGVPTSSAVGVGQFIEGTWLDLLKDPVTAARIGIDTQGKTDAQLLELRKDPNLAVRGMAAFAAKNKATLENTLGRNVSEAEVHMAHFLGAQGAVTFLNGYKNSPDQSAADLMPAAAKSNPQIFYDGGNPRTVAQIYNDISNQFNLAPSKITFQDNEVRKKLLEVTEKELADDPIAHAAKVGSHVIMGLDDDGGFRDRGSTALSVAQYYNVPMDSMKPFTDDEANALKGQLAMNDSDRTLNVMANIQSMGDLPARAAMKQLDSKDPVFAHAGGLFLDGNQSVAEDIIKGRKRITENPTIKSELGVQDSDISAAFSGATKGALSNVDPMHRQAIQDAAMAYMVEQQSMKGQSYKFDKNSYTEAIQSVLGGNARKPMIETINGQATLLPKGVDADTLQSALRKFTIDDYTVMSDKGLPPRLASGAVPAPYTIAKEVMMQAVGGGKYRMMLDDGSYLITGSVGSNGRLEPYLFKPDPKLIQKAALRPDLAGMPSYIEMNGGMIK